MDFGTKDPAIWALGPSGSSPKPVSKPGNFQTLGPLGPLYKGLGLGLGELKHAARPARKLPIPTPAFLRRGICIQEFQRVLRTFKGLGFRV